MTHSASANSKRKRRAMHTVTVPHYQGPDRRESSGRRDIDLSDGDSFYRTRWEQFKDWLSMVAANWRAYLRAALDVIGLSITAFLFWKAYGARAFMSMVAVGLTLAEA